MNKSNYIKPRVYLYQSTKCAALARYLALQNFDVLAANNSNALYEMNATRDIFILDHVKSANGVADLSLLRAVRNNKINSKKPIIILSELSQRQFILQAYKTGADDYVVRPCDYELLVCKINAHLKSCDFSPDVFKHEYTVGRYTLIVDMGTLVDEYDEIKLTPQETRILAILAKYVNTLVPASTIIRTIWHGEYNFWIRKSLDVYICNLRKYLQFDASVDIVTTRGKGYTLLTKPGD